jgi:predicted transposase YbfD/YdcC
VVDAACLTDFTEVAMSQKVLSARIQEHFQSLTDPRRREVVYPLINIVMIAVCAVLCGADDFVAIAKFGEKKRNWFAKFLDLSAGIPSHDRFNAVLAAIKPAEFEKCLLSWIVAIQEITDSQVVAIDGKALRRSYDSASGKAAIHMVSAWATANSISLGQVAVDAKSNEITAIPKLLEILELSGCLVTIDAMGCQTEIAAAIVAGGAHYVLAVKDNQPTLSAGIREFFDEHAANDFANVKVSRHETEERGHGRDEARSYYVCAAPDDLPDRSRWAKLAAIGMTINDVLRGGKATLEMRFYILSKKLSARQFAAAVRGHWGIENRLHWQLDVSFNEDQSRIRQGHGAMNFSILRRTALSLLKNNKTQRVGVKNKRLIAGWDEDYLLELLMGT